jgi:serine/threonine protein kinase/uncharacterized RDD family membrane protein YckC
MPMGDSSVSLCLACFKADMIGGVCPSCGFNPRTYRHRDSSLPPGRPVGKGRYIIGEKRGQGGFGITYVAFDGKNNERVAIKEHFPAYMVSRRPDKDILVPHRGHEAEYQEGLLAFQEEANTLRRFNKHDGIVHVLNCFPDNQSAYMVMEYLSGWTLGDQVMKRGCLPPDQAVAAMVHVLDGLKAVHNGHLIHRDVKPDNIFITRKGQIKLIDFGAARHSMAGRSKQLTAIISEPFAPFEQYRSDGNQGPWTDIYAIGATFYYILTGRLPHRSPDRVGHSDPLLPPSRHNGTIPGALEHVILQSLDVEPGRRFQSIDALLLALRRAVPAAFGPMAPVQDNNAGHRPSSPASAPQAVSERIDSHHGPIAGIAGAGRRVVASVIDGILLFLVMLGLVGMGTPEGLVPLALIVLPLLYTGGMMSSGRRATFGMMAMEIRIQRSDGRTLSFWRAIGRHFLFGILSGVLLIGPISILMNRRRQGLHDRAADTVMVNAVEVAGGG